MPVPKKDHLKNVEEYERQFREDRVAKAIKLIDASILKNLSKKFCIYVTDYEVPDITTAELIAEEYRKVGWNVKINTVSNNDIYEHQHYAYYFDFS